MKTHYMIHGHYAHFDPSTPTHNTSTPDRSLPLSPPSLSLTQRLEFYRWLYQKSLSHK